MVIVEILNPSLLLPSSSLPLPPYPKCTAGCSHHHRHRSLISTPQWCPTYMNLLSHHSSLTPLSPPSATQDHGELESSSGSISGNGGNRSWNRNGHGSFQWWRWWEETPYPFEPDDSESHCGNSPHTLLACLCSAYLALPSPEALASSTGTPSTVWEVRGGKWTRFFSDSSHDSFVFLGTERNSGTSGSRLLGPYSGLEVLWQRCRSLFLRLMLPEGYPGSVSGDYLEYSLWRAAQGIASQISGVLSTQALLYAVGLGKGAIPAAAAVNWVLKDGIGYLSKILLSKYGRHFDVNPKGWRLFADLLENAAYGMEIMTPAFPQFFVFIGAVAGAGRSAAALIQAATRSCFYAGFAVNRNFAEVIAKGEAQGMVSKFLGIILGIALSNCIGLSTPLALTSFGAVTAVHMYCNFKSYQSIQLRTLNTYRASLVFSEYLWSGLIPSIKDVNDEEPLFTNLPYVRITIYRGQSQILSIEAKYAAGEICSRLKLGSKLSEVVNSKEDAFALFDLFRYERYLLVEEQQKFQVILKEDSSLEDMLKSLFHVNYLFWLERNVGIAPRSIADECRPGGRLQISLDYVQREFIHIKHDGSQYGWRTDGLIARPAPNRIRQGHDSTS